MKKKNALKVFISLLLTIIIISILFYFFDPKNIIENIGARNGYIIIFFVALIGGVSSFTTGSYIATLFTFAQGGLSPLLLGLFGGLGIFLGDLFFYYLGKHGEALLTGKLDEKLLKFQNWVAEKPLWVTQLLTYLYSGLTPLPNDILTLGLAVSKVPLRKVVLFFFIGSIQLQIIMSYLFSIGALN